MLSALIREFLIPLLLFFAVRRGLSSLFAGSRRPAKGPAPASAPATRQAGGMLHKDPVCGTYVSSDSALIEAIGGQVLYFCSKECQDRFRKQA